MFLFGGYGFDWDAGNKSKCGEHGVSVDYEIKFLFLNDPLVLQDIRHSVVEDRLLALGEGRKRQPIFVISTMWMKGATS